jgi:hypothetical protein
MGVSATSDRTADTRHRPGPVQGRPAARPSLPVPSGRRRACGRGERGGRAHRAGFPEQGVVRGSFSAHSEVPARARSRSRAATTLRGMSEGFPFMNNRAKHRRPHTVRNTLLAATLVSTAAVGTAWGLADADEKGSAAASTPAPVGNAADIVLPNRLPTTQPTAGRGPASAAASGALALAPPTAIPRTLLPSASAGGVPPLHGASAVPSARLEAVSPSASLASFLPVAGPSTPSASTTPPPPSTAPTVSSAPSGPATGPSTPSASTTPPPPSTATPTTTPGRSQSPAPLPTSPVVSSPAAVSTRPVPTVTSTSPWRRVDGPRVPAATSPTGPHSSTTWPAGAAPSASPTGSVSPSAVRPTGRPSPAPSLNTSPAVTATDGVSSPKGAAPEGSSPGVGSPAPLATDAKQ